MRDHLNLYNEIEKNIVMGDSEKESLQNQMDIAKKKIEELNNAIDEQRAIVKGIEQQYNQYYQNAAEIARQHYLEHGNSPHRRVKVTKHVNVVYPPDLLDQLKNIADEDARKKLIRTKQEPNLQALKPALRSVLEGKAIGGELSLYESYIKTIVGASLEESPIIEIID